jgi:hypothetical protein
MGNFNGTGNGYANFLKPMTTVIPDPIEYMISDSKLSGLWNCFYNNRVP